MEFWKCPYANISRTTQAFSNFGIEKDHPGLTSCINQITLFSPSSVFFHIPLVCKYFLFFFFFFFVCLGRGCVLWWLILLTWTRAKCTSMKEPSSLSTSIYRDDRVRNIWYGVGWQYHALKLYYSTSLTVSLYR